MKKLILLLGLVIASSSFAQNVGEKVQIDHGGSWYEGKIEKINAADGTYYVSYDGWDASWNEWVTKDKLKGFAVKAPLTKFSVGDHVEVEYGMVSEPATIIEVGENKYHIKYDKTVFGDKWVTEGQIKKL